MLTPIGVTVASLLRDIAKRVDRNVPSHRDPDAFHAEKSEIASDLRQLADRMHDDTTAPHQQQHS
jgi:hypothetical protein